MIIFKRNFLKRARLGLGIVPKIVFFTRLPISVWKRLMIKDTPLVYVKAI